MRIFARLRPRRWVFRWPWWWRPDIDKRGRFKREEGRVKRGGLSQVPGAPSRTAERREQRTQAPAERLSLSPLSLLPSFGPFWLVGASRVPLLSALVSFARLVSSGLPAASRASRASGSCGLFVCLLLGRTGLVVVV